MAEPGRRFYELGLRVLDETKKGTVKWHAHTDDDTYFQTSLGDMVMSVSSVDKDNNHPYRLILWKRGSLDEEGNRIWTTIESLTTSRSIPGVELPDDWQNRVAELWRHARGDALNLDAELDKAFAALEREN
jgi:hypothetical protein